MHARAVGADRETIRRDHPGGGSATGPVLQTVVAEVYDPRRRWRKGRSGGPLAGAGIVVRNSIILVDFIELRLLEGLPLEQAVVDAGAVRFRPMALTAAAMIVGAGVILFDPIFQGLAISLMAGEVASLLLSRMAVPVLYYMAKRHERTEPVPTAAPMEVAA